MFRTSPSAIALWELCPARAIAKYVWGYEEPESDAMREGTRLHRIIQRYLNTGAIPDTKERAAHACIKVLPVPAGSIYTADIERVVLHEQHHGYIDWARGSRVLGDLKFTKSVRYQQAKNPATDPQRIIYAVDAFAYDSELRKLTQHWTVTQFDGAKALTLKHVWTKDGALKAHDKVIKPAHEQLMAAVETNLHWNDAPKNHGSCDMYPPNGCMMKNHGCTRSLKSRLMAIRPKPTTPKATKEP
jgi:hypothetical protein